MFSFRFGFVHAEVVVGSVRGFLFFSSLTVPFPSLPLPCEPNCHPRLTTAHDTRGRTMDNYLIVLLRCRSLARVRANSNHFLSKQKINSAYGQCRSLWASTIVYNSQSDIRLALEISF